MKKLFTLVLLLSFPILLVDAQVKFGYFSYEEALHSMPDYAIAQRNLENLQNQYAAEMKRAEQEFNSKYEEFLDGQSSYATAIRQKRQAELQELMEKNLAFKEEANRLLEAARKDAETPLRQKLAEAVKRIGAERGYAFILNTDGDACPYIDPAWGEDINMIVKDAFAQ